MDFTARFEYVQRRLLRPDVRYQRTKLRYEHIRRIAAEFNPDYFGVLHVVKGGDDRYAVIDGQHRLHAVEMLGEHYPEWGPECELPCLIHATDEAALTFVGLNNAKPLSALEKLKARYAGGEPLAVALVELVRACGLDFAFDNSKTRGGRLFLTSVQAAEDMYRSNPELLQWVLMTTQAAWPGDQNALKGSLIKGLFAFANYAAIDGEVIHTDRLVTAMSKVAPDTIRRHGIQEFTESVSSGVALVLLELYNKESAKGRFKRWTRSHLLSLKATMINEMFTPEERSERARKGALALTPEERSERSRKGSETKRQQEAEPIAS